MIASDAYSPKRFTNLRAYLAGTGATGALIGGTVVVFLSLAAFLAFKGLPFGGSGGNIGSTFVGSKSLGPPEQASVALGAAPRAIAAAPVPGAPVGAAPVVGANPGGPLSALSPPSLGNRVPTPTQPGPGVGPGVGPGDGSTGPIKQVTQDLCGQSCPQQTGQLADQLDNTVTSTLNGVGGVLGQPTLGDRVGTTVTNLTGGLLGGKTASGQNGLLGGLLGGR